MGREVLVIGAQGVLGNFIAEHLSADGWDVTRAGRRPEEGRNFRQIDLADADTVRRACGAVDLVVNTAHHPQLILEKTVLKQGGTLIDLIELSESEQAQLDAEATDSEGLVVIHTGLGGIAYLAIADMLRDNSDADTAEYALMVSAAGSSGRAGGLFAHQLLTSASHHGSAAIPFPKPIGTRRCLEVGDDSEGVPRAAVSGVPVRHYLCLQPRALNSLVRALDAARIISALPRASFTAGSKKLPNELSEERVCEWVAIERDGTRLTSSTIEGEGYYRMTLAATLIFADALSRQANRQTGLRSIDELLTLSEILPALERRGIAIRKQASRAAEGPSR
jgi:NAD(P)-dependent dehydrogenase (short-subunit alcohol dehydrogenase family)